MYDKASSNNLHRHYLGGLVFALVTAISLGSITTQAKLFYAEGGNAMMLMLIRFLIATVIFGLLVGLRQQSFRIGAENRLTLFWVGLSWSGAMVVYLLSVETITIRSAVLLLYTYPLLILFYAMIRRQLKPDYRMVCLFLLAFAGLFLALPGADLQWQRGTIFALLASLGSAITFIKAARLAPLIGALVMTFWVSLIGLIAIFPWAYHQINWSLSATGIGALCLATTIYLVAILCQFQALSRLPATTVALILNLEPVVSIAWATAILHERLSLWQWSGVALVLFVLTASMQMQSKAQKMM